jgi:DNA-binding PadR family transcriptional regulator
MRIFYIILNVLYTNEANSKLYALTQKDIQDELEKIHEKKCERSVYNRLRELLARGHIEEGLRIGNKKTYFLTPLGIQWMKEMQGNNENKEEEVNVQKN